MDGKGEDRGAEQLRFDAAGIGEGAEDARPPGARPGPTWRAWLLSIVAAIVLSAAATLLLGGSFRLTGGAVPSGACGSGSNCCPAPTEK